MAVTGWEAFQATTIVNLQLYIVYYYGVRLGMEYIEIFQPVYGSSVTYFLYSAAYER